MLLQKTLRQAGSSLRGLRGLSSVASRVGSYPSTEITTLPNQMRVASEPAGGDTATVGVWINTGSRYESEQTNGVAHFLEHMLFKGTTNRTRQQLEQEVENIGGHLNAYTSREQTVFYAKVNKAQVPQAMDILSDMLQNSLYTEQSIEWERDVILRELQEVESQMEEVIFDRLHETAYRNCALGRTILGSIENIKSLTRDDIEKYITTHYTGPRMVVAGAGVEHQQLVDLTGQKFGNVPVKGTHEPYMEPAKFLGSDIRVRFDDMPLAHVAYGFPTAGWNDADNFPLLVIQSMLGCWDKRAKAGEHSTSYLISQCADKNLGHSVSAFNTQYSDTGLFGVYAVGEKYGLDELMWVVQESMTSVCYNVTEEQVEEAKNHLRMNVLAQLDGTTAVCEDIGRQVLFYGRRMHPTEVLARIEAVDARAVRKCAMRYFYDRDFALAAVGPTWELSDYAYMREHTYWQRY